ncbi:mdm2-binding protein-like isoform X1 [Acipenser oxyrinchus oxyrinchus]|uniref:Mdm2-binding protein-like isoform X1 n=1 Tax=Acipenser oxyrinchus oxyrinchus TaxID=40147 RepID=A0AAD8GFR9_ACIOX|nr:mdm2-binding protein-like isoform X1 [Acipenser oxyrinchus oxyrinchus]
MDRYVLCVICNTNDTFGKDGEDVPGLTAASNIYELLKANSSISTKSKRSSFPACSLSGVPATQRCYFAIQALHGNSQFCSSEWEEIISTLPKNDREELSQTAIESCQNAIQSYEEEEDPTESQSKTMLFEEAAESLHQLSDKLPPPGKALLDIILLASDNEAPKLKEFLPVLGSLKHMKEWHSANITIAAKEAIGWQRPAAYLSACFSDPEQLESCIEMNEIWRGNVLIREKKFASEVKFSGFSLKGACRSSWSSLLCPDASETDSQTSRTNKLYSEVFHYYKPVLGLIQLVSVSDLPIYFCSSTEFELCVSTKAERGKSKLLLDHLATLQGKVGALFTLSCTVSSMTIPPISQLSTRKWKEYIAKKPKLISAPDIEMKGETCNYFLLVQGKENGGCKARLIHSATQINGAAALVTINGLLNRKPLPEGDLDVAALLGSLPRLRGEQLIRREKKLAQIQLLVLKECLRIREKIKKPASIPVSDLKVLLALAREQYLKVHDANLPKTVLHEENFLKDNREKKYPGYDVTRVSSSECSERSVLQNFENLERNRQRMRAGIMLAGSESLLGPKDRQRLPLAQLDAKELLKYFTPEGQPSGELQPLQIQRGENAFHMSPDLTPRKVQKLLFDKASNSHYHGIEFCLDDRKALEKDKGFVKLQSRLIRYETHTTCTKESCPIPFALSPVPSPAVLSEPGSVPDGEAFQFEQKGELTRQKRRSREVDSGPLNKRLAKFESVDSLLSQYSGSSGPHHSVCTLRDRPQRPVSVSSASRRQHGAAAQNSIAKAVLPSRGRTQEHENAEQSKESRSQKHARMLKEVVAKTLKLHGIAAEHKCFAACSQRLFEISKFYLKDLQTSRGLHEEMKKAAKSNAKQVIDWVLEKTSKK